jgi:alcohol dehydrogenase
MKAAIYHEFQGEINIESLEDPHPSAAGVVIDVQATGICRSDWHGWMGHDSDIRLPHVPGHELAGIIVELGREVKNWQLGDRVTLPFVCGCGKCNQCDSGNEQVCENQFQPGFTAWGSFAEYVAIDYAQNNLVKLPDSMGFDEAAGLGCRFVTAFRALVDQGKIKAGQWVAIHGCGGVGLSAIMIARAFDAKVIAIDIDDNKLKFAKELGATHSVNALMTLNIGEAVRDLSGGGADISMDALGSEETLKNSVLSLKRRGKHIQVGLLAGEHSTPSIPMAPVIANELELIGSHGMQAHRYDAIFKLIDEGKLDPKKLIGRKVDLKTGVSVLTKMNNFEEDGITIINSF